jgi:hypothetical protein
VVLIYNLSTPCYLQPLTVLDYESDGGRGAEKVKKQKKDLSSSIPVHKVLGWPLIPKRTNSLGLQEMKDFTRAYVTATYRKLRHLPLSSFTKYVTGHYTHNKHANPPWKSISDHHDKYIASDSMPDGVFLRDPSKLQKMNLAVIWAHWTARQGQDLQGLVFLQAKPGDKLAREHAPASRVNARAGGSKDMPMEDILQHPGDESGGPAPESPAASAITPDLKMMFLQGLSQDGTYQKFVGSLAKRQEVSYLFTNLRPHLMVPLNASSNRMASRPAISLTGQAGSGIRGFCLQISMKRNL